jgi:hypothetical protein
MCIVSIIIFSAILYIGFFMEIPIIITGKMSVENCEGVQEDVKAAWCVLGEDGFTYFLTDENWELIDEMNNSYIKYYGKTVIVTGPVKSIKVDGKDCFLIKIQDIST